MINLTSFTLAYRSPPVSVGQLLDFFESVPRLREVVIRSSTPISGTPNGRLVSLACLKRMDVSGHPSSNLFDHLLIPVGAHLAMGVDLLPRPPIEGRPPRFPDNLGNFPNFTAIKYVYTPRCMRFSGPNGAVSLTSKNRPDCPLLGFLAQLDTSKTESLEFELGRYESSDSIYQTLLPMKNLRTLRLVSCIGPYTFLRALDPSMNLLGAMACPRLEELFIVRGGTLLQARCGNGGGEGVEGSETRDREDHQPG